MGALMGMIRRYEQDKSVLLAYRDNANAVSNLDCESKKSEDNLKWRSSEDESKGNVDGVLQEQQQ